MKIIFAGTPVFAATALRELVGAGHDVAMVLTQPDRPSGRGLKMKTGAVKAFALASDFPVSQPPHLRDPAVRAAIAGAQADAMVVAAYGLIIPPDILRVPRLGCINIHASLLPRWRGAAPIQRAILAGDAVTGITIMQMAAGLDAGPILARESLPIMPDDTASSLHDKLAALGGTLIVRTLDAMPDAQPQDSALATYAAKVSRDEARIDWTRAAADIERGIRAFNPEPGAHTAFAGTPLKIWRAALAQAAPARPGEVIAAGADGIVVACGDSAVRLLELQRSGGRRLPAAALLSGFAIPPGDCFDS